MTAKTGKGSTNMRKWMPLLAVCLGTFMLLIDVTIVSVALPQMTDSLDASFSALQWVVDIYVLVLAALLMAIGRCPTSPAPAGSTSPASCSVRVPRLRARGQQRHADRRARCPGPRRGGDVRHQHRTAREQLPRQGPGHRLRSGGRSTAPPPRPVRYSEACSPSISAGGGSSWSTCPSASPPSSSP